MQITLYHSKTKNKRGDEKSDQYILHFDEDEGLYVMQYIQEFAVRAPGGNFIGVDEHEEQARLSVLDFIKEAPPEAKDNFNQALRRMFSISTTA